MATTYEWFARPGRDDQPFSSLHPKCGVVPREPFELLPRIFERAQQLVAKRTAADIHQTAVAMESAFGSYCDSFRDEVLRDSHELPSSSAEVGQSESPRLTRSTLFPDVEPCTGIRDSVGEVPPLDMPVIPYIPTRDDYSDLQLLKLTYRYLTPQTLGYLDSQPSEIFGVLALRYIEDCVKTIAGFGIQTPMDVEGNPLSEREDADEHAYGSVVLAAEPFAFAVEAICYAEHLAHLWRLGVTPESDAENLQEAARREARKLLSERGKKSAAMLHADDYRIAAVIEKWIVDNHKEFKSASQAAEKFLSLRLEYVGYETILKHIRIAVRKHNLRLMRKPRKLQDA